jgi:hypothetical protein
MDKITESQMTIKMAEFDLQEAQIEQQQKSITLQKLQIADRRQQLIAAFEGQKKAV